MNITNTKNKKNTESQARALANTLQWKRANLLSLFVCTAIACSDTHTKHDESSATALSSNDIVFTLKTETNSYLNPLLGVNAGPVNKLNNRPSEATEYNFSDQYREIGTRYVRTHDFYGPFDMAYIYPDRSVDPEDPSAFDWQMSDTAFSGILRGGFKPYLRLGDSWGNWCFGQATARPQDGDRCCASPADEGCGGGASPAPRKWWVEAATKMVERYYKGGWGDMTDGSYVEIWNEPDNNPFWDRDVEHDEFFALFAAVAESLHSKFPTLKIGGPGLSPASYRADPKTSNGMYEGRAFTYQFLKYMSENNVELDFFSYHVYADDPVLHAEAANFYRNQLNNFGFNTTELHVSEYNLQSLDKLRTLEGAAALSASWIQMQKNNIKRAMVFRGNEVAKGRVDGHGIFFADEDDQPKTKVAGHAMAMWAELFPYEGESIGKERWAQVQVTSSVDLEETGLYRLATLSSQETRINLLFVNTGDENINYTLDTNTYNLDLCSQQMTISKLLENKDGSATKETTIRNINGTVVIPENGVQLITLNLCSNKS